MKQYGDRLFNDGWEFSKLPLGSTRDQALASSWMPVILPHDWLIWQAKDLYESADAWYRRILHPEEAEAETVILCFDGVYMDSEVLLNGEVLCAHPYGYTAFQVDLSGRILPGENEILVHIRHQSPNTRWYSGSGIYRDVTLKLLPRPCLLPDSLYTVAKQKRDAWHLRAESETFGGEGKVWARLLDARGQAVASAETVSEGGKAKLDFPPFAGEAWSPAHPALYTLEYGMGPQTERARIGLRTLRFDPDRGFFINGENIKMKGVCLHQDLGALGSAFHISAARRQLEIMRGMGVNALRTSHNPPARQVLDLCDEMGILVVDELLDMWERPKTEFDYARFFPECEAEDVALWIRRDRNHPCVVMWSIGNEIYDMFADDRGRQITALLRDQVRLHDPEGHAAVTFGSNYMPWEGAQRCAGEIKIPGYNYAERFYDAHHAAHPDWVIYGSETASVLSSRGIYHFPASKTILSDVDLQCSALGNSISSWGAQDLGKMLSDDLNNPYSMGQFVWSGIDYIGEPTPYHTRSCYFGQADTCGFPKDAYFLFRSMWTEEPTVHIGVCWDWNEGQMIDVPVYSSCPRVELFLNGESLGRRNIDRTDPEKCRALWTIPYEKGVLQAVGYGKDGEELCVDERRSFGDTASLRLSAEAPTLKTDGSELAFIAIEALDREGIPVANARDRVYVNVEGGGVLLGVDNGDAADEDEYKGNTRRLFSGKMLAIIGPSGKAEPARVSVRTASGLRAELSIPTLGEECPCRFLPTVAPSPETEEIPVRKVEIIPLEGCELNSQKREALFARKVYPENATEFNLCWQATNLSGIPTPCARVQEEGDRVRVIAEGDGEILLRALYGNAPNHPERISHLEIRIQGVGQKDVNPYEFVSAGLYDLQDGDIGAGNEQGISFARDSGDSMIGFRRVNFGAAGSDRLTLSVFALNGEMHPIRLYDGDPREGGRLLKVLEYQKPSIWNVYQDETWDLPERLTGVHTVCLVADRKFHLKGFRFEKQSRAFLWHHASEADQIYGDSFRQDGDSVREIGNNVVLTWENMDFGEMKEAEITVRGRTPLEVNAITLRMKNEAGEGGTELLNFRGDGPEDQVFRVSVPGGCTEVSFVFLPGCRFDFDGFSFQSEK